MKYIEKIFFLRWENMEKKTEELIQTREGDHLVVAIVSFYAFLKLVGWSKVHQLSKDSSSGIHKSSPSAGMRKHGLSDENISNRKIAF